VAAAEHFYNCSRVVAFHVALLARIACPIY
jgi:hypothetical protein